MKTKVLTVLLTAFATASMAAFAPSVALANEYRIDTAHSFIQFRTKHLGYSWLLGRFNEFSGEFTYNPKGGVQEQSVKVEVNIDSLDSNHAERDKHLLGSDFLDAEEHPLATFESTSFEGDANGGVLAGKLSLHGVTRPISISLQFIGEGDDPWGGYRAGFAGTSAIRAADFGIDNPVVDQVELDLFVEGIRN